MKNQVRNYMWSLLFFVWNPLICMSQEDDFPDSPDGSGDPLLDPAPINDFIWLLLILAILLGFCIVVLKRKRILN